MIDGQGEHSWPLWMKLVFIAMPAAGAAAAGMAASLSLTTTLTGSLSQSGVADSGVVLATAYDLARTAARYAVFIGAPAAVLALIALLLVGAYGPYPDGVANPREELPNFLGRIVMGSALFAAIGLICQLMLAAKVGAWI